MEEPLASELRERGEITIPKKIRDEYQLETGQKMEFIPIGPSALLLTPKRLELNEARRLIRNILKQTKISSVKVLEGLKSAREETFHKYYGKKHGKRN